MSEILKTTYEVRYPVILNFREIYKEIINPYFVYPNAKYSIINEDTHQESIRMTFSDSNNILYFSYDRILFAYDGDIKDLTSKGSILKMVFDILEKLKEIKTFTKVSREMVELIKIQYSDLTTEKVVKKFIKEKVKNSCLSETQDIGLMEEGRFDNFNASIHFGPFIPNIEIERFDIYSLSLNKRNELKEKNGILIKATLSKISNSVSQKSFIEIGKKAQKLVTEVNKKYGFE